MVMDPSDCAGRPGHRLATGRPAPIWTCGYLSPPDRLRRGRSVGL